MLDRLKSLPLTIFLTLLIWMYAESQGNPGHGEILILDRVPVLISGPAEVLSQYEVVLETPTVRVTLAGTKNQIESIRNRPPAENGVFAYLDLTPRDLPNVNLTFRTLRFVTPPDTSVDQPPRAGFRLVAGK
jgi:hypothetical protein